MLIRKCMLCEKHITPEIVMTENEIMRVLDHTAIQRVFSNILSNVAKYSEGDLKVTLTDSGKVIFQNKASGITEVEAEQLFDRFYTVQNAKGATGIGLSIAKLLIEKMSGKIYAEWENGMISIVVELPLCKQNRMQ